MKNRQVNSGVFSKSHSKTVQTTKFEHSFCSLVGFHLKIRKKNSTSVSGELYTHSSQTSHVIELPQKLV
jgi:hypothetical protein